MPLVLSDPSFFWQEENYLANCSRYHTAGQETNTGRQIVGRIMHKVTPTRPEYPKMFFSTSGILEEFEKPKCRITWTRKG